METLNIYCDESCHLNYTSESYMGFSCIVCNLDKIKEVNQNIKELKIRHGIPAHQELKWSKICKTNYELYKDVINYFFIDDDLACRTLLVKNKHDLKFTKRNTKSDFYYKMMYFLIIKFINPHKQYNIYLDIKDTNSSDRINNLKQYLNRTKLDYNVTNTITKIQTIRSYESCILQLSDILLGAIMYANKYDDQNLSTSKSKLVQFIREKSNKKLTIPTLQNEPKLNIFISDAQKMKLRGENDL